MKKVLEILHIEHKTSKKGTAYSLGQCVIRAFDGSPPMVGEAFIPQEFKETAPGLYEAEFELAVDFDKRVMAKIVGLKPYKAQAVAKVA